MNYQKDLAKQLKAAKVKEQEAYEALLSSPTNENISSLNIARVDVQTIQSRIENYGKSSPVMMEYVMPSSQKVY